MWAARKVESMLDVMGEDGELYKGGGWRWRRMNGERDEERD